MWFSAENIKKLSPHSETLRLDDVIMEKVEHATILRMLLDQNLSLNEQTSNVAGKLAKYVPIMYASWQY